MGVHNNTPLRLGLVVLDPVRDTCDWTVYETPVCEQRRRHV